MAALTSCCSKVHFHHGHLGSSSPRRVSAFRFSDRFKLSNFRFLQIQMLQNKPIIVSPLHAVPSQPLKEDLETDQETSGDAIWQPAFGQIVATSKTYNRITICEEWGSHEHLQRFFRKSQEQRVDTKV